MPDNRPEQRHHRPVNQDIPFPVECRMTNHGPFAIAALYDHEDQRAGRLQCDHARSFSSFMAISTARARS
jgi:hypothetical protein